MKEMLTTGEIARFCGVNHRTVHRWIKDGLLTAFALPGRGDHRIAVNDCIAFLREYKIPIPSDLEDWIQKTPPPTGESLRVLVVEDDPRTARFISSLLKAEFEDLHIQLAEDVFRAGLAMGTFRPHLILLDLKLPDIDGFQALEIIRNTPALEGVKIIVVSSHDKDMLEKAVDKGADYALEKPVDRDQLFRHVRQLFPDRVASAV